MNSGTLITLSENNEFGNYFCMRIYINIKFLGGEIKKAQDSFYTYHFEAFPQGCDVKLGSREELGFEAHECHNSLSISSLWQDNKVIQQL